MTAVITPSPYLRDHLLAAANSLRKDAESARLALAQAERDVAEAREILAEAEAQHDRARAEVDGLARDIAWAEEQAARRTAEIDAATAAHHAAVRHVHDEPAPVESPTRACGNCGGEIYHNRLLGQWEHVRDREALCDVEDPDGHYADPNPDAVPMTPVPPVNVARPGITTPPVPHDPAGPDALAAAIDAGSPLTTRGDVTERHRHRATRDSSPTRGSRVTGALRKVGLIHTDDQHDDEQGDA